MPMEARKQAPERGPRHAAPTFRLSGSNLTTGQVLNGRYRLGHPVRTDTRVWRAEDPKGQTVALKAGPAALINREFGTLRSFEHPSIVRAVEWFSAGDDAVLVLEYLPGGDLVSLSGSAPSRWLDAVADVVAAMQYLHARGIAHRDLKARNIMFDAGQRARLIDFGSAAAFGSAWTAGGATASATDPARGSAPVGAADDIYALAALLHELLHGAPPETGHRQPAHVPGPLATVLDAWLATSNLQARPGLNQVATVIESLLVGQGGHAG